MHHILRDHALRPSRNDHVAKSRHQKLIRVTSLNECREHRCDDLKAYKSSQLTDLYFKPMQNSPVHDIVQITNLSYVSYQQTLLKQQILYGKTAHSLSKVV